MASGIGLFMQLLMLQLFWMGLDLTDATTSNNDGLEDVRVQFYMLQLNQWTSDGLEAKFKAAMAQALTTFCIGNFTTCGFNSSDIENFTASSVRFSPGYPVNEDSRYLSLRISIAYSLQQPGAEDGTNFILPAADTTTILKSNRMNLNEAIGYYIVYVGSQFYSIPPPHFINLVVISATGGFTLLLIITALTMRKCIPEDPRKLVKKSHKKLSLANGHSIAGLTTETIAAAAAAAAVAAAAASIIDKANAACSTPDAAEFFANGGMNPGFRNSLSDCAAEQIGLSEAGSSNGDVPKCNNNEGECDSDK